MKLLSSSLLAAAAAAALSACSGGADNDAATDDATASADTTAMASPMPAADDHAAQFLTDALKGDNSEMKLGQFAADKGASQGVRDFGKTLADDHAKAKTQAAQVATSMGVSVPSETTPEADAEFQKLQGLSGDAFDKEFASYMVDDHKKDIAKFEDEAASSDPATVTDLAKQTLPGLRKHLEMAQSLDGG